MRTRSAWRTLEAFREIGGRNDRWRRDAADWPNVTWQVIARLAGIAPARVLAVLRGEAGVGSV